MCGLRVFLLTPVPVPVPMPVPSHGICLMDHIAHFVPQQLLGRVNAQVMVAGNHRKVTRQGRRRWWGLREGASP